MLKLYYIYVFNFYIQNDKNISQTEGSPEVFGFCHNHKDVPYSFYCFDDKIFLCDDCFKEHRKHNMEIRKVIEKYDKLYKTLLKLNRPIKDILGDIKNKYEEIIKDIKDDLSNITTINNSLDNDKFKDNQTLFNMNYNDYDQIQKILDSINSINKLTETIQDFKNKFQVKGEYINFKDLSKEVKIIDSDEFQNSCSSDIMLEKINGLYSLIIGNNERHIVVDLGNKYFFKSLKLNVFSPQQFGCVPKSFSVLIGDGKGNFSDAIDFDCENKSNTDIEQEFKIEKEARFIKIVFHNTWGEDGGAFILIKRMKFTVAEIEYLI
ncbi:MAG: B-box zinc finger protein [archaeon]|nr:B-box zinc finger protein [archaeon]